MRLRLPIWWTAPLVSRLSDNARAFSSVGYRQRQKGETAGAVLDGCRPILMVFIRFCVGCSVWVAVHDSDTTHMGRAVFPSPTSQCGGHPAFAARARLL